MNRKDIKGAIIITLLIVGVVLMSSYDSSSFLFSSVILPAAIFMFAIVAFVAVYGFMSYARLYKEDHPYIPYVGKMAPVLCPDCFRKGIDSSIEMEVGTAFEYWPREGGEYKRTFRRIHKCRCSAGHEWLYDPILERNSRSRPVSAKRYKVSTARLSERLRKLREGFHNMYFGEDPMLDDIDDSEKPDARNAAMVASLNENAREN